MADDSRDCRMENAVKITYLGDSITFGQYVDPGLRWTALIDWRLGPGWTSRNEGVNGETTRLALERFPQAVQADPPDILTIQYGFNDCNRWQTDKGLHRVSRDAFVANLIEMVARAEAFGVGRVVILFNYPTLKGNGYESDNHLYCHLTEQAWAKSSMRISARCNLWRAFMGKDLSQLLFPDGLHLSAAGHALYAEAIWPVIERCAKELDRG